MESWSFIQGFILPWINVNMFVLYYNILHLYSKYLKNLNLTWKTFLYLNKTSLHFVELTVTLALVSNIMLLWKLFIQDILSFFIPRLPSTKLVCCIASNSLSSLVISATCQLHLIIY